MESQSKKVAKVHTRPGQDVRKERRSATGMSGAPKKGGCGGKFTWSGDRLYAGGEEDAVLMMEGGHGRQGP
ncbi:unnamed protein product [Spirodela intermedia]|uniref:Uncharacterized protein n=1 Tax=Spirodela intermedia TaxID=51605 RepID=A0A7I8JNC0_SPIIN|nr:unnamed protein product [Spirodela intermedia]CAA6671639.1 unnamed protein product [Spirodela intermedia]